MPQTVDTKRMAAVMKALSHPNRLELFLEIARDKGDRTYEAGCECECFVSEIVKRMKIGAPTVSHHLKELTNAGLIETERQGKFLVARINWQAVAELRGVLEGLGCRI